MPISPKRSAEIAAIDDDQIDLTDIPEMPARFFQTAKLIMPTQVTKQPISIRVDDDVLGWFKAQGKGHLSRMNAVLRAYMLANFDDANQI